MSHVLCAHCQTIGDVYYCTACGDLFVSEQPICPDDPHWHVGDCIVPYDEWLASELESGLRAALAEPR